MLFWLHLVVGAVAGVVILVMSVTGALLAFQPQIVRFIDRDVRTVSVPAQLDALVSQAASLSSRWDSVTLRWSANPDAPVSVGVAGVSAWNAMTRGTASLDPHSGAVTNWQPSGASSLGQRVRQWVRFAHTGEVAGWPGQLAAGLACVGGVMLVWTGLSLALRRLSASRTRRTSVHAVRAARAA